MEVEGCEQQLGTTLSLIAEAHGAVPDRVDHYKHRLNAMFTAWGNGKDTRGARNHLSKQFLNAYIGSLENPREHAAFVFAYAQVSATTLQTCNIVKRFTCSSEADILLSAIRDGFVPSGITTDVFITLCETAYVGMDYALVEIARGIFEQLTYHTPIEVGLIHFSDICREMVTRVLCDDLEGARRLFDGLLYYYQDGRKVPAYVSEFFRRFILGSYAFGTHFSEWGITDEDAFIDLAHWVHVTFDEVGYALGDRSVFRAAKEGPVLEVFENFKTLDDCHLRPMSLLLLVSRLSRDYFALPQVGISREYAYRLTLGPNDADRALAMSAIFNLDIMIKEDRDAADRMETLMGIPLDLIGRAINTEGEELEGLQMSIERLLDTFTNKGTAIEILVKQLVSKRRNDECPLSTAVLCLNDRYTVLHFTPDPDEGPITPESYRSIIVEQYRKANQEKRTMSRNELIWMCHAMTLILDASDAELTFPFWHQEFYDAYVRAFPEEGTGQGDIETVFGKIKEIARETLQRSFCTFSPGGGDLVLIDTNHDLYKILGIRSIHFTLEKRNLMGIAIRFDNAVARFLADYRMNIYVRGDLSLSEAAREEHKIERELSPADPSEPPYVAFCYEMLILGTMISFLSGSIMDRAALVQKGGKAQGEREAFGGSKRNAIIRRGHKRELPTGQHFSEEQAKIVKSELGIDLEALNRDLGTVDDGGGYTTFVLPIEGEEWQRHRRKPNVWKVSMRTKAG